MHGKSSRPVHMASTKLPLRQGSFHSVGSIMETEMTADLQSSYARLLADE